MKGALTMGDNRIVHFDPYRFTSSAGFEPSSRKLAVEFSAAFEDGPSYEVKWVDENENGKIDAFDKIGFIEYAFSIAPGSRASTIWDYEMRDVKRSDISMYAKHLKKAVNGWSARIDRFRVSNPKGLSSQKEDSEMAISFDWSAGFWIMNSFEDDSIRYFENMIYPPVPIVETIIEKGSPDFAVMFSAFKSCFEGPTMGTSIQVESTAPGPRSSIMPRGYVPVNQP